MGKRINLNKRARQINFGEISRTEADPKARIRAIVLMHVADGKNKKAAGSALGINRNTVTEIIKRVNKQGIDGIYDEQRPGRPPRLRNDKKFLAIFQEAQKNKKGGRLTGYDAQRILAEMGIQYELANVYNILHKLGLSWVSSRSAHPSYNEKIQSDFKKTLLKK